MVVPVATSRKSSRCPMEDGSMENENKHPIQRLMDNPWLLLVLGLIIPFLSYTVWGWIDLARMPLGQLP